jgi:hypothetical protein
MNLLQRAGSPLAFSFLCCLAGTPAVSQTLNFVPEPPVVPTRDKSPADIGTPASAMKPARLESDAPSGVVAPAPDSAKRPLDAASAATRELPAPIKTEAVPANQPAPSQPAATRVRDIVSTIKDSPAPAPAVDVRAMRLEELKRLSKEEIQASATDKFVAYVLKGNERTVVLDFPTTLAQARMFGRVILFIERDGTSKTRVMTVAEVQKWLVKNTKTLDTLTMGNNIRASEFARFFNTARLQEEPLTTDERELYDWLLQMQLLREEELGVAVVEPEAIVVSVPQVSTVQGCAPCSVSAEQRRVTVEHEFSHARFATDIPYQNYVGWFWSNGMNTVVRSKFTQFLRKRGYDTSIRELVINEMQAFLMHTPNPAAFNASDVGMTEAELTELRQRFQAGLVQKPVLNAGKSYRLD